jgi:hypothetical protein
MAKKQDNNTGSGFGNFLAVMCVFAAIILVIAGLANSTGTNNGQMATATVEDNLYEQTPIPTSFGVNMDCNRRSCEQVRWP